MFLIMPILFNDSRILSGFVITAISIVLLNAADNVVISAVAISVSTPNSSEVLYTSDPPNTFLSSTPTLVAIPIRFLLSKDRLEKKDSIPKSKDHLLS